MRRSRDNRRERRTPRSTGDERRDREGRSRQSHARAGVAACDAAAAGAGRRGRRGRRVVKSGRREKHTASGARRGRWYVKTGDSTCRRIGVAFGRTCGVLCFDRTGLQCKAKIEIAKRRSRSRGGLAHLRYVCAQLPLLEGGRSYSPHPDAEHRASRLPLSFIPSKYTSSYNDRIHPLHAGRGRPAK